MVTYDGEDVTSQAAITNVTTGEPVENAAWTTTEIGEYKFQAVYDSYTSDPVTVSAIDKNKDKEFYRYVLLLKFTYMTCGNCVTAQGYFDALDEADRDHFLVVAAHQPEGMPMDPYWCSEGISLKSKMKVGVYPTWSYNFEDLVVGIGAGAISKTSIRQQISHAEKTYPAVCGVKATSTLEGSTAKIEATVQFQAAYDGMLSNVVSVKVESDSESDAFYRHVLLTKFTATWCGPCAQAQRYFEQLKPEESERFLVVAAHQGDRLTVPVGSALGAKLGYQYVPTWNYDFRTVFESVGTGGITATSIRNQIKSAMEEYPAVCGVKAESELDGQTAKIRATVRFQQAGNYKIACVLTENDIQKTNNETLPVFNHVLRAALTNMEGDPIAPAVAEAGERSFDFEVTLNNGWDSQNCEFVIYVFKEEEDAAFIVNNGAVCPVGGKVDYKYESVE